MKIKEKSQELSNASVTVLVEKFNQSKSDEILICSKNTSKRKSFNNNSLILVFFFSSLMMFWNFHSIIIYFLFFRNINSFCRQVILIKIFCICLWMFSNSWRMWLHSVFILFHFIIKKVRLHLQSRCIHSMQWLNSLSTQHFFCKWLQCLQKRMTACLKLVCSRRFLQRKIKFFVVQWKDMKEKWFSNNNNKFIHSCDIN